MGGYLTHKTNDRVLDGLFGGQPIVVPPVLYFGLSLSPPYKGGYVFEPTSYAGYARVPVANTLENFPRAFGGIKTNACRIKFNRPLLDWGDVRSVFIADSPIGGTVLAMAELAQPMTIHGGEAAPMIAPEALFLSHV